MSLSGRSHCWGWKGLPTSRDQEDWFYRRSGVITGSPYMLRSDWLEHGLKEYLAPNCVALAARDLGVADDRVRLSVLKEPGYFRKSPHTHAVPPGPPGKATLHQLSSRHPEPRSEGARSGCPHSLGTRGHSRPLPLRS